MVIRITSIDLDVQSVEVLQILLAVSIDIN